MSNEQHINHGLVEDYLNIAIERVKIPANLSSVEEYRQLLEKDAKEDSFNCDVYHTGMEILNRSKARGDSDEIAVALSMGYVGTELSNRFDDDY